jgi:guanylate kinase
MREPLLIVVAAPSGGGKSTVLAHVFARVPGLTFSVSHTTRRPRTGENDGREYHFVTKPRFLELVEQGAFLEWAEVHDHHYGTSRAEVDRARAEGRDLVLDIDVQGAAQVVSIYPSALTIFLMPPSRDELERRLRVRGSDSEVALRTRLRNAEMEMARAGDFQHVVRNDHLERAVNETVKIIEARRARH